MNDDARADGWPAQLTRIAFAHPFPTLLFWVAILALCGAGIRHLGIDTSTASFLDRSSPAWTDYQHALERHGGDEFMVVALTGRRPWDPQALKEVLRLTRELAALPGIRRVDSLASVPLLRDDRGALRTDAGLAHGLPESEADWQRFIETVRNDRIARHSLVSTDERGFALNLLMDDDVDADRAETVAAVRAALAGLDARITGVPVFRTEVNARTRSELMLFVPVTLLLLAGVIALALPSPVAVAVPLVVGAVATVAALGCMGALGIPLSLSTMVLPSTLLALGCAYAMHVVTARGSRGARTAMIRVVAPVTLSGVTTALGFIAMATVPIDAIRELATYGALGVLAATAASITLAPALLALAPVGTRGARLDRHLRGALRTRIVAGVIRRRRAILVGWGLTLIAAGFGLTRLEIATDIILWFPEGSPVREDYNTIRRAFSGITPVNVLVEPRSPDGSDLPELEGLRAVDALAEALEARPEIGKALSFADPLRQIRLALLASDDDVLPGSQREVEELLLLLDGIEEMDDVLHVDRRSANVLLRVDDNSSDDIVALGDVVTDWWTTHGRPDYRVTTTGIMYEFGRAEEEIAYGQLMGLGLAALVIGAILLIVLHHVRIALIALFVNLVPLAIGFGALGLLGVALDAATVCLGSIALGIAVDDTIHIVSGWRAGRALGLSRDAALHEALSRSLPALLLTTIAISIGFLVLGLSGFTLVRNLGLVTSGLVSLCLVADLTLLPALLLGTSAFDTAASKAASDPVPEG